MKSQTYNLMRFDADEGFVFDWKEPRFIEVEVDGRIEEVQEHLYAKTLYIGETDSIENYVEVEEVK